MNLDYILDLTNNPINSDIYYPTVQIIDDDCPYADNHNRIQSSKMINVGKFKYDDKSYTVLAGTSGFGMFHGLGNFYSEKDVGNCDSNIALFGCASKEIAEYFGKHFGYLIIIAKFGDLPDFSIES